MATATMSNPDNLPEGSIPRPWLSIKETRGPNGRVWDYTLSIQVEPGVWSHFQSRVTEKQIRAFMKANGIDYAQIGSIFGSIFKGIKKIAHITGVDKVLKVASAALHNPLVKMAVPGLGLAASAMDGARGILTATVAAKKGDPRAKDALLYAQQKLQSGNASVPEQQAAQMAARIYRIAVMPG